MENWTIQEEADRLRARFEGINRAKFAREHGIKGGDAYIYQHMSARRPISLDAALRYSKGFNVPLTEISPRLAMELEKVNEQFHHSDAPYHEEIEKVIDLMEKTDDRGRLKCLLAVEDALAMHDAVTAKSTYHRPAQTPYSIQDSGAQNEIEQRILDNYRRATIDGKRVIENSSLSASKEEENNSTTKKSV